MPVKAPKLVLDAEEIVWTACGGPLRHMVVYVPNRTYWLSGEGVIVMPEDGDITLSWDAPDDTGCITLA